MRISEGKARPSPCEIFVNHSEHRKSWCGRVQLKRDGTRWRTGGEMKGKLTNGVSSQYPSLPRNFVYPAFLPLMRTPRLNWRPCRFKWTRPFRRKTKSGFCACAITFQTQSTYRGISVCYIDRYTVLNTRHVFLIALQVTRCWSALSWKRLRSLLPTQFPTYHSKTSRLSMLIILDSWNSASGDGGLMKRMLLPGWGGGGGGGWRFLICVRRPSIHKFFIVVRCPSRHLLGQLYNLLFVIFCHLTVYKLRGCKRCLHVRVLHISRKRSGHLKTVGVRRVM